MDKEEYAKMKVRESLCHQMISNGNNNPCLIPIFEKYIETGDSGLLEDVDKILSRTEEELSAIKQKIEYLKKEIEIANSEKERLGNVFDIARDNLNKFIETNRNALKALVKDEGMDVLNKDLKSSGGGHYCRTADLKKFFSTQFANDNNHLQSSVLVHANGELYHITGRIFLGNRPVFDAKKVSRMPGINLEGIRQELANLPYEYSEGGIQIMAGDKDGHKSVWLAF